MINPADTITYIKLRTLCKRTPDWNLLAKEIVLILILGYHTINQPHYKRAGMMFRLPEWHVLYPNLDPPEGIPARYAYYSVDCRELKKTSQKSFFTTFPKLHESILEVMAQLFIPKRKLDNLREPCTYEFESPDNSRVFWANKKVLGF